MKTRFSGTPSLLVALFAIACSKAGLQPVEQETGEIVDDRLDITGSVCTSVPSDVNFPVKIMFIVDTSGSMQFTDPSDQNTTTNFDNNNTQQSAQGECLASCATTGVGNCASICSNPNSPGRQAAVQKVVDRFGNNPAVEFAIVRFNARITVNGGEPNCEGFTRDSNCIDRGIQSLAQAEIFTDYQGAFTTAYEVLQRDMEDASPVERSRTKYVVMFISDGAPDPKCTDGCGNDRYLDTYDSWCDLPRGDWCDEFLISGSRCEFMQSFYPGMREPCKAYNSETQIVQRVNEIMSLADTYGVAELRIHSAYLFAAGLPDAVLQLIGSTPAESESLIRRIAEAGDGLYRNFSSGQQIDFLDINYASVARPYGSTSFIVTNQNAWPDLSRLAIDSDGDSVPDTEEFDAQLSMLDNSRDSDGDGYCDRLELDRAGAGFHPGDPAVPAKRCIDREDLDGDGLNGCEEAILGTDPKIADSDRDRVPDGLEFLWGTNPSRADVQDDIYDFDDVITINEIRNHSDPRVRDPEIHADFSYSYEFHEQPETQSRRKCYDFEVRRVRLVTTQGQRVGGQGYNEILLYFGEGPSDDPTDFGNFKAACVRGQYIEPSFKDPATGKIEVAQSDFMDLPVLLQRRREAELNPALDPCIGAELR